MSCVSEGYKHETSEKVVVEVVSLVSIKNTRSIDSMNVAGIYTILKIQGN